MAVYHQSTVVTVIVQEPIDTNVTNQVLETVAIFELLEDQVTSGNDVSDGDMVAINWIVSHSYIVALLLFKVTQVVCITYVSTDILSVNDKSSVLQFIVVVQTWIAEISQLSETVATLLSEDVHKTFLFFASAGVIVYGIWYVVHTLTDADDCVISNVSGRINHLNQRANQDINYQYIK